MYYHFICSVCGPKNNYVIMCEDWLQRTIKNCNGKIPDTWLYCNHKVLEFCSDDDYSEERIKELRKKNEDYSKINENSTLRSVYLCSDYKLKKCYDKCD